MDILGNKKGSITVYLSIITAVCLLLAQVLVDASRARGASTIVQNAMDISTISVLSEYDQILKDMYGLLALSGDDPEKLQDEFEYFLERNLNIDKKTNFNLYNFELLNTELTPIYNLAETEILEAQILEYMKYRGPKEIAEGFGEKLTAIKNIKKQSQVLQKKLELDEKINTIQLNQQKASDQVYIVNSFSQNTDVLQKLNQSTDLILSKLNLEKENISINEEILKIQTAMKNSEKTSKTIVKKPTSSANKATSSSNTNQLVVSMQNKYNNNLKEIIVINQKLADISKSLNLYLNMVLESGRKAKSSLSSVLNQGNEVMGSITSLKKMNSENPSELGESVNTYLDQNVNQIDKKVISQHIAKLDQNIKILEEITKKLNNPNLAVLSLRDFGNAVPAKNTILNKINYSGIKNQIDLYNGYANDETNSKKAIQFHALSSANSNQSKQDNNNFSYKDIAKYANIPTIQRDKATKSPIDKLSLSSSMTQDIVKNVSLPLELESNDSTALAKKSLEYMSEITSIIDNTLDNLRDEMYVNEYVMGNFSNFATASTAQTQTPEYCFAGFEKRILLEEKKGMENVFEDAEAEYILWGDPLEQINIDKTEKLITLSRFAFNSVAIYSDSKKVAMARAVALAAGAWAGAVGVILVQNLILLSLAYAESLIDTYMLMTGKSVPLFKLGNMWSINLNSDFVSQTSSQFKSNITNMVTNVVKDKASSTVNSSVDYITDNIEQKKDEYKTRLEDHITNIIDREIDMAFSPLEKELMGFETKVDNSINDLSNIGKEMDSDLSKSILDISNFVKSKTRDYISRNTDMLNPYKEKLQLAEKMSGLELNKNIFEKIVTPNLSEIAINSFSEKKNKIFQEIQNEIKSRKSALKEEIKGGVSTQIQKTNKLFTDNLEKLSKNSKENIGAYLSKIGGSNKNSITPFTQIDRSNLRFNFLSTNYRDYLRLFLMGIPNETKLKRIGDLIELNIRTIGGKNDFMLSNSNTYLKIKADVGLKYMFMTSKLFPSSFRKKDNDRYVMEFAMYKGY